MKLALEKQAFLFDLDGTLVDTANDLAFALNQLLQTHDRPPLPLSTIRPYAGCGTQGLLKIGFGIDRTDPHFATLSEQFLNLYEMHLYQSTNLFSGMEIVLDYLDNNKIPWGIVTNKSQRFTLPLVKHLKLDQRTSCVISGDTLKNSKPHPDPILHGCELLHCHPQNCVYVGDAKTDVLASQAAGTLSLVALYGYIAAGENPKEWDADGYVKKPQDIMKWIE